ncbi:ubiquinone biosynthesis protein COQ9 [Geosmithia morbida]|uniref:Ubiquinone biosynthesis protein n=1 Tax=Geosmithia morbida TaxID=1094350 RepID=A0A9P4YRT4_9HYPO|nr:ubiquinone biosynthesis protein COQ9 [Geosmithia morbida]KAF4121560.1 ubiquinone biosynthesis protein COQ9 [Geosmithia morbida]
MATKILPTARLCCTRLASSASRLAARRSYHSYDHPAPPGPFGKTELAILSAAYKHVPEHGFTHRALGLGARDAGYIDMSPAGLPEGVFSLIRYHLVTRREALADVVVPEGAGVGVKVAALTWERLLANKDVIHQWQEALAVMAQPTYVASSLEELAKLSDEIWFLAGDKSVDSSWYTKRASLSAVFTSSELFMTNDTSPQFQDTRRFLDRRLGEVSSMGSAIGALGQWVGFTASAGLNVLRSKGVRI